jgi:hypothetical protein
VLAQAFQAADGHRLLVAELEAERVRRGLHIQQAADAIGITKRGYLDLDSRARLRLETCGGVAAFLEWPAERVLRLEGYWEKLSAEGCLLAPATMIAGYSIRKVARALGVDEGTVQDVLYRSPRRRRRAETLERWAVLVGLDPQVVLRAAGYLEELPLCACGCGQQVGKPEALYIFSHPHRPRVTLRCRRCPTTIELTETEAKKRLTHEWNDGVNPTYLCKKCVARENIREADRIFLQNRKLVNLKMTSETDRERRKKAHQDQMVVATRKAIALVGLNETSDRKKLNDLLAMPSLRRGLSERALLNRRNSRAVHSIDRPGLDFSLCPRCGKLLANAAGRDHRSTHGRYDASCAGLLATTAPPQARRGGRPRKLRDQLRWLLRYLLLRDSWGEVAAKEGFARATVANGAKALVGLLPGTWHAVFGADLLGRQLDELAPMPRVRAVMRANEVFDTPPPVSKTVAAALEG